MHIATYRRYRIQDSEHGLCTRILYRESKSRHYSYQREENASITEYCTQHSFAMRFEQQLLGMICGIQIKNNLYWCQHSAGRF